MQGTGHSRNGLVLYLCVGKAIHDGYGQMHPSCPQWRLLCCCRGALAHGCLWPLGQPATRPTCLDAKGVVIVMCFTRPIKDGAVTCLRAKGGRAVCVGGGRGRRMQGAAQCPEMGPRNAINRSNNQSRHSTQAVLDTITAAGSTRLAGKEDRDRQRQAETGRDRQRQPSAGCAHLRPHGVAGQVVGPHARQGCGARAADVPNHHGMLGHTCTLPHRQCQKPCSTL